MTERLLPRGLVRLHHALGRTPDVAALDVAVHEHANLARAEVPRQRALLAHDDAVTIGARREVARLDERGHLPVLDRAEAQVVHPAPEEIAKGGRHRRGGVAEQVREQIEVVDAVRLGHSHVGSRALEARESPGAVAHGADGSAPDPLTHELCHGMEAEDVADLQDALGRADDVGERAPLRHRQGQRLLHEAVLAGAQALPRQGQVIVGGGHQVHRVHEGQRRPDVGHRARFRHPGLDGEGPPLGREIRDPDLAPELAQHAQVLLPPAPQAHEQNLHSRGLPSPPRSSAIS